MAGAIKFEVPRRKRSGFRQQARLSLSSRPSCETLQLRLQYFRFPKKILEFGMRSRASQLRTGVQTCVTFVLAAASALMLACAGISSGPSQSVQQPPPPPPPSSTHSVQLSWDASTSPDILGYNVYRATYANSCGSFARINSLLNTGTLYTDTTVADGTSYCYATTAVNTTNTESGYSNVVTNVQIPAQ